MPAYIGQSEQLLCAVRKNMAANWMYQKTENAQRYRIYVNGSLRSYERYTIEGSGLIINEVKASDAGIYLCGHGSQLYHKLELNVSGMYRVVQKLSPLLLLLLKTVVEIKFQVKS